MNRNRSSGWPRALGQLCWLLIVAVISVGCGQTAGDRGVPPGDEATEDPEGPPGTVGGLSVELRCAPFAEVHASWGAVAGATGYTLMQGSSVLHEGPAGTTSAVVTPVPGAPFEFTLHARTEADTQGGPVTLPTITGCVSEQPPVAAGW